MEELQYRIRRNAQTIFYYIALLIVAILLLAALIIGAISVRFKQASKTGECVTCIDPYRLPKSVMPSHYNVHLHPNVKALTISGSVEIDIDVLEATTCVLLHTEELDLKSVILEQATNTYKPAEMTHDKVTDVLKLSFDEKLTTDKKYKLKIEFSGKIRTDMRGFYIGSYEQNGRTIPVASTQMEATEARTSFPCFDEPEFKAAFQITFTVLGSDITGDSFRVLSNMPEKTRTAMSDGGFVVQFEPTVKMSSYLVAYVMGEFDPAYERALDIDFTIYTHPGEQNQGAIALEVSKQVTEFFTSFFGIKYALSKMDLIGIPDFRAGAMENWGLITFRDLYIYADSNTPENYKQAVREVVAHEIAHQWTGNLVTCGWWSHLWLNEGFATFFETFSLDKIFPEKKLWDEYLSMTIQPLLVTDSLPSTHAVVVPNVSQQSDIDAMFDTITYNKGSAVLRMIYHYLGEEKFKTWIRAYFNKFQYKNAFTEDLFTVLKEQNPADTDIVSNAMTWTHQAGYPVVTASQTESGKIVLSQERFYAYPPEKATETNHWWIPAAIMKSDGNTVTTTFTGAKSSELSISGPWFKVNAGQIGLYRVNYSPQLWDQLIQEIKNKNNLLTVPDKFGLIDDIFALAKSGHTPIGTAFELAKAVSHDDNFVLWNALLTNLYTIERIIFTETFDTYYHRFVIQLLNDTVTKLGFDEKEGESDDIKQLRPLVLGAATAFGHEAAISEALRRFDRYMNHNDTSAISKDMKAVVFNTAAREGKESAYFLLYNRFMETEDPHEKTIAMNALPSTTIPALLKKTLELVLTPAIKAQDGIYTIRYVSRNKYGVDLAWNWVRENYDAILEKYGKRTVDSRLITGATSMFASTLKLKEAEEFWKSKTTSPYVGVALETIKGNIQFLKSNAKNLNQWLTQNYQ